MSTGEPEKCRECGRHYSASYAEWQWRDHTCGMSPVWNEDGENHEDCINECLNATKQRLKAELALARAVIEAAEAMREDTCHGNALEAFDAALAEWRKVKG